MPVQKERQEIKRFKSDTRNLIDATLLGISITFFGLIATIKPELLSQNPLFTLQLVLIIPFVVTGLLSRIKEAAYERAKRWQWLTFASFTISYGFFINAVGLVLSFVTPLYISLIFFGVSMALTLLRASIVVSYVPSQLNSRVVREIIHVALIVFLGILPALRIY